VIDLHSHLLPGVDDGPPHLADALALARAAVEAGTEVMVATPHVSRAYHLAPADIGPRVDWLAAALDAAGVALDVRAGGELAPERISQLSREDIAAIGLGGGSCVLLECPFTRGSALMDMAMTRLQEWGFRILLAHPERSPTYLREPQALRALVERGAMVQVTAASLRGDFGRTPRQFAKELFRAGRVHVVASDAHDVQKRGPGIRGPLDDALRSWGLPAALAGWLTEAAPRAVLADGPLPPPPRRTTPRRRWPLRS